MKLKIDCAPIDYAKSVTVSELKKTIRACKKGEYDEYTDRCRICFEKFLAGELEQAGWWSRHAEFVKPEE